MHCQWAEDVLYFRLAWGQIMNNASIGQFAPFQPRDRTFFLLMLTTIWAGIFAGFVPDVFEHFQGKHVSYALVVHLHAAAYVGWLVLLTTQMTLIRVGRADLHRKLGIVGLGLVLAMAVLGPWTAFVMQDRQFGTPDSDPPFLILQLLIVVNFTLTALAGLAFRRNAATHKRLMLIATILISGAGFARWIAGPIAKVLGSGFVSFYLQMYACSDLLLIAMGVYDIMTRRRLHPAYIMAVGFGVSNQIAVAWIYNLPAWKPIATQLIGH